MRMVERMASLLLVTMFMVNCAGAHDMILEAKDVQFFKVEAVKSTGTTKLRISGLAFRSALSVRNITTEKNGSTMIVLVHLGLAKKGTSGSFAYEVDVPESITEVRFGKESTLIWQRKAAQPPA